MLEFTGPVRVTHSLIYVCRNSLHAQVLAFIHLWPWKWLEHLISFIWMGERIHLAIQCMFDTFISHWLSYSFFYYGQKHHSDLWQPKSNQLILELNWTFVPHLKKFSQEILEILHSHKSDRRTTWKHNTSGCSYCRCGGRAMTAWAYPKLAVLDISIR